MRYAFQDDENCFFVLDLMLGGDLRCTSDPLILEGIPLLKPRAPASLPVHLDRLGALPEPAVRVVTAEISSALVFLHEKRIIHRYVSRH